MKPLHLITLCALLFACTPEPETPKIPPFEDREISASEKMKIAISEAYLNQIGLPDSIYTYLDAFYKARDYKPCWINDSTLTSVGSSLKNIIDHPYNISIPKGRLLRGSADNYIQDEINITIGLAQTFYDLKHGIIDFSDSTKRPHRFVSVEEFDSLAHFSDTGDLRLQFIRFGPNDTSYQVLAKGLIDLIDHYPLDTNTFQVRSIKLDSTEAIKKARLALISKGYLDENVQDSTGIAEGLTKFQIDNGLYPDGIVGKFTSMALNESNYHRMERILLSMDKIRATEQRPEKYIRINLPEYMLRLYINDSLKSEHNIVIGKIENQTPELRSRLKKIVVYPYWNVPYSISSKEILPAVKRNVGYLAKNNYKVYRKGELVDPYSVDWKSIKRNAFPFKIVQDPGPKNSLGILKFDFYNSHSVYFHDTPAKALFGTDVRAYSHGCMRTQNPVDLAKVILERDLYRNKLNEMTPDSLDSLLTVGNNYEIKLLDPIPIFVEYQTITRNKDNQMVMHIDVYGRDEEFLKIMRN